MNFNFKDFYEKFKKGGTEKNIKYLIVVFLIGIVLVITASFFKTPGGLVNTNMNKGNSNSTSKNTPTSIQTDYEHDIVNQLTSTLEQMDGVGKVQVMITFENNGEDIPAVNENNSSTKTEQKDSSGNATTSDQETTSSTIVTESDSDGTTKPFIAQTTKPKATAAFIVAQGADNSLVQLEITKTVMDLLDISESKVNVYPMKK